VTGIPPLEEVVQERARDDEVAPDTETTGDEGVVLGVADDTRDEEKPDEFSESILTW
jgi:hypothetical protein